MGDRKVEVKATQGNSVALSSSLRVAEHLVVLRLARRGAPEVTYNGPAELAWQLAGRPQKNGQMRVSLSRLRDLMASVKESDRLPVVERANEFRWPDPD